jgi:hypothetical protein
MPTLQHARFTECNASVMNVILKALCFLPCTTRTSINRNPQGLFMHSDSEEAEISPPLDELVVVSNAPREHIGSCQCERELAMLVKKSSYTHTRIRSDQRLERPPSCQ